MRYLLPTVLLLSLFLGCSKNASGPPDGTNLAVSAPTSTAVTYNTADGWTIHADFIEASNPRWFAILLHQRNGSAADWKLLAEALRSMGCSTLSCDLRGAGRSLGEKNGEDAPWDVSEDITAAIKYLKTKGLDDNPVSLIGASYGANNAMIYAGSHKGIGSVVLISPGEDYHGLKPIVAAQAYMGKILIVSADGDGITGSGPNGISSAAKGHVERKAYPGTEHGTELLAAHSDCAELIAKFVTAAK